MAVTFSTVIIVVFSALIKDCTFAEVHKSFCKNRAVGNHPHPDRCDKFVVCSSGHEPTVMSCPIGTNGQNLYFNPDKNLCDYVENIQCGKKGETTKRPGTMSTMKPTVDSGSTVCYGAKDDAYGEFIVKKSGFIRKLTLKHKDGEMSCNKDFAETFSRWGCTNPMFTGKLALIVSLNKYVVIFPNADVEHDEYAFYNLPGFDENSDQIVFEENYPRVMLTKDQKIQFWYGEDFIDASTEALNAGRHCIDVHIEYFSKN